MCGLWGVAGAHLSNADKENAKRLAMMSTTRGEDSTGALWCWRHKKKIKHTTLVQVARAFQFVDEPAVRENMAIPNTCLIMGHDRAATLGAINENNAHPIIQGKIIGCHNGTIDRYKPDKAEENITSDSRKLFKKISEEGATEALADADIGLGAYAVTFYNSEDATLSLARNSRRPLFAMWSTKGPGTLYWASEQWMLEMVRRCGYEPSDFGTPSMIEMDQLFTFSVKQNMKPIEKKEIKRHVVPFVPTHTYKGSSVPVVGGHLTGPMHSKHGDTVTPIKGNDRVPTTLYKTKDREGITRELVLTRTEDGIQWSVKFTEDSLAQHLMENILTVKPQSNHRTKAIRYPRLGIIDYYNDYGEFIHREWQKNTERNRDRQKAQQIQYKGYLGNVYLAADMQQLVAKHACACCDCMCDIEDELYWISSDEFFCRTCAVDGSGEFFVHKSQMYKGCIVDDEGN